ncbi:hypothetical protein MTO96_044358 [Rhipicephalus appendiculatus]
MLRYVTITRSDIRAHAARKLLVSGMVCHVERQGAAVGRFVWAPVTLVRFFASMRSHVALEGALVRKLHRTDRAFKAPFASVYKHVALQAVRRFRCERAQVAKELLRFPSSCRSGSVEFPFRTFGSSTEVHCPPPVEMCILLVQRG